MRIKKVKLNRPKSQIEVDQHVLNFLGDLPVKTPEDLVILRSLIQSSLDFHPYNDQTKEYADSIQWRRTASEIIQDKYVYEGKACSDIAVVFLVLCKAAGIGGQLVKLITLDKKDTHSIVEVNLNGTWYRLDPSSKDSVPFEGELTDQSIWNKKYKVYKKGRDVWDMGLDGIGAEDEIYK